jgi:hypothetical protein
MFSRYAAVMLITLSLAVAGCQTPRHSNTLIFGTHTKLALDVSAGTTGSPSVTLGYKREEAVWMPLLANQSRSGKPATCTAADCLFVGQQDADQTQKDTYSVLASFGAKATGNASTTSGGQASGGGQLAQFFATGLAARYAAQQASDLLAIPPEHKLTPERIAAAIESIDARNEIVQAILPKLVDGSGKLDESKMKSVFEPEYTDLAPRFKGKTPDTLAVELEKPQYWFAVPKFEQRAKALK